MPVDAARDFGAHGRFDTAARSSSWEVVVSKHRRAFVAAAALVVVTSLFLIRR